MVQIYNKACVSKGLCIVDGIGRSGKMLVAKLVSNLPGVDAFQTSPIIEEFLGFRHLEKTDDTSLTGFMHLMLDSMIYDRVIGRNLNTRFSDSSSVYTARDYAQYFRRATEPDGMEAVEAFQQAGRTPSLLTHNALMNFDIFEECVPDARMIFIGRHPVDVVHSWYLRLGNARYGDTPTYLTLSVDGGNGPMPWWMKGCDPAYLNRSDMDRLIMEIARLWELTRAGYAKFNADTRARILPIGYEKLFTEPAETMTEVARFLDREAPFSLTAVLHREGLYRQANLEAGRAKKHDEIKKLAGADTLALLNGLISRYEQTPASGGIK